MRSFIRSTALIHIIFLCLTLAAQAQDSRSYENLVITGVDLYSKGEFAEAKAVLKNVVENDPSNDAALYYLAMIAAYDNDKEQAEIYFQAAATLDPGNFWYRYRLAKLYSLTDRQELAIDMYEKMLKDFPKEKDVYFELVEMYVTQREYQKALDVIDEIDEVVGVTESLAMYRFNILRVMDKAEEAYESLKKYNSRYSSPYVLTTLADYEMSMYNDSTALAYYDEALSLVSDYAPALLGKAETLRMTRRYDEYFSVLNEYLGGHGAQIEEKTDYLMAVLQRTDPKFIRSFISNLDEAVTKTVEAHPKDSLALQTAAIYFYSTERNDQAEVYFRENAESYPESYGAAADYVEFLMYADRWEELSREGRKAYERFPYETAFLEMASVGDYNLGNHDKVLEICEKVLEVAPRDSSKTLRAWSTIGDVYHELGDSKKAFKAYEKALKVNPGYAYVLNNYAYFLGIEGRKLKKAEDMSYRAVQAEPDNANSLDTYGWILYLLGKLDEAKLQFKKAMIYGGKDSAVILDHYAEVLYALKEYDMAFIYWNMALQKNDGDIPALRQKILERKREIGK
jgi:tetratricopeptide (TPR) repeat protein